MGNRPVKVYITKLGRVVLLNGDAGVRLRLECPVMWDVHTKKDSDLYETRTNLSKTWDWSRGGSQN